jgi:folate-binding Fe-S cluster repair protein YgfZ
MTASPSCRAWFRTIWRACARAKRSGRLSLTAQGKWLADFFVFTDGGIPLRDGESPQITMLIQRLSRYRLRMKASLRAVPDLGVYVAWPTRPNVGGIASPDPRLPNFAWRILSSGPLSVSVTPEDWDRCSLEAGLPEGKVLEPDRVLLEARLG